MAHSRFSHANTCEHNYRSSSNFANKQSLRNSLHCHYDGNNKYDTHNKSESSFNSKEEPT